MPRKVNAVHTSVAELPAVWVNDATVEPVEGGLRLGFRDVTANGTAIARMSVVLPAGVARDLWSALGEALSDAVLGVGGGAAHPVEVEGVDAPAGAESPVAESVE